MKENYMPSETEVNAAEGMMTETQKELTEDREKMFSELEKMGKNGYIKFFSGVNEGRYKKVDEIRGVINNHTIFINSVLEGEPEKLHAWGTVDDRVMSSEQALNIFNKFKGIAIKEDKIVIANEEVKEEAEKHREMSEEERKEVERKKTDSMVSEILD